MRKYIDTGEMFSSSYGVELLGHKWRAFVATGWNGGIQCFRNSKEEAIKELPRLFKKYYGYTPELDLDFDRA